MRESYKTVSITFTEGENLLDIAKKLEDNEVCTADDFLSEFNKNQGFDFENDVDDNGDMFYRMEGYFYPDTYEFYVQETLPRSLESSLKRNTKLSKLRSKIPVCHLTKL